MKKIIVISFWGIWCIILYSVNQSNGQSRKEVPDKISFPDGYRNWTHIKSAINNPSFATHSGFHHIYANQKALQGYQTGKFADGAILVFDVLESIAQQNGDLIEGKRKLVDVMVKDSVKYIETGGWGYEEFIYQGVSEIKTLHPSKTQCFSCHTSQKNNDFVFSKYRE